MRNRPSRHARGEPSVDDHRDRASLAARVVGPVPRCVVTPHDPDCGIRDVPTLRLLFEPLCARSGAALDTPVDHLPGGGKVRFGVYGTGEVPGEVRVGEAVTVLPRKDAA